MDEAEGTQRSMVLAEALLGMFRAAEMDPKVALHSLMLCVCETTELFPDPQGLRNDLAQYLLSPSEEPKDGDAASAVHGEAPQSARQGMAPPPPGQ